MRIATWNLESLRPLTPDREVAFRQAMNKVGADVWVFTETWFNFPKGEWEGYRLAAQSSAAVDLEKWPERCWVEIWVKSNLEAKRLEVRKCSDRMACVKIEKLGHRDVVVSGTVLPWGGDKLWPTADDFCAAVKGQVAEWEQWGMPSTAAFILAGDLNQSLPYQQYFGYKKGEEALTDAFKKYGLKCLTEGNIPLTGKPRIDHICMRSDSLKPLQTVPAGTWEIPCVNGTPVTDHYGIYVDFDILPLARKL